MDTLQIANCSEKIAVKACRKEGTYLIQLCHRGSRVRWLAAWHAREGCGDQHWAPDTARA